MWVRKIHRYVIVDIASLLRVSIVGLPFAVITDLIRAVITGLTRNLNKLNTMNKGFIYLITNTHNTVLYVGVTNNLVRRIAEHKAKVNKGFTYKYNCDKLVYFEKFDLIIDAIAREKQLKNWKREWKNELISKSNPGWDDLSDSIGLNNEIINNIKSCYEGIADQVRNDCEGQTHNYHKRIK